MLIRESEMAVADIHNHARGMIVHPRLFVRSVVNVDDLYVLVLKGQPVMFGFNLGWILRESRVYTEQTHQYRKPQELAKHTRPLDSCVVRPELRTLIRA